jgi:hypothetical protein
LNWRSLTPALFLNPVYHFGIAGFFRNFEARGV